MSIDFESRRKNRKTERERENICKKIMISNEFVRKDNPLNSTMFSIFDSTEVGFSNIDSISHWLILFSSFFHRKIKKTSSIKQRNKSMMMDKVHTVIVLLLSQNHAHQDNLVGDWITCVENFFHSNVFSSLSVFRSIRIASEWVFYHMEQIFILFMIPK